MSAETDSQDAALAAAAAAPLIVQVDQQNIQQQSLRDQLAYRQWLAQQGAVANGGGWGGCFKARFVPPAAVGPREGD